MPLLVARRVATAVPSLLGVSLVVFVLLNVLPGDPLAGLVAPEATRAERDELAHSLGLDRPIPVQYAIWLGSLARGDLGYSWPRRRSVAEVVGAAFGNTVLLASAAGLIGLSVGIGLGMCAALAAGSWLDRLISATAVLGLSMPSYWLALVLIIIFAATLQWLPSSGMGSPDAGLDARLRHLLLPALAASVVTIGLTARTTRASLLERFGDDFVSLLRAKGLADGQVLRHVVKNAAPAILTVSGLQVGYLLGGSVLVETIFAWPGLGQLIFQSIATRDLRVVQSSVLVIAVTFIVVNLVVDLLQLTVNPRLRRLH